VDPEHCLFPLKTLPTLVTGINHRPDLDIRSLFCETNQRINQSVHHFSHKAACDETEAQYRGKSFILMLDAIPATLFSAPQINEDYLHRKG
jgi:hypothetical protein